MNEATRTVLQSWETLTQNNENKYVFVNSDALNATAQNHFKDKFEVPDWQIPGIYAENDSAYACQTLVSSTINYAFMNPDNPQEKWTLPSNGSDRPVSGAMALHTRTHDVFGEDFDISSDQIRELATPDGIEEYLPGIPHAESRMRQLDGFANGLDANYYGSVRTLLQKSSVYSESYAFLAGRGLIDRLLEPEFEGIFQDTQSIGELQFPFQKRAQLAAILYYGRAYYSLLINPLVDIDSVGPVADYQVPRALRAMGILGYSSELAEKVDNWQPVEAGSQPEVEIRAATVFAVHSLQNRLNELRAPSKLPELNIAHTDAWLWLMGRGLDKQGATSNPHVTVTTAY